MRRPAAVFVGTTAALVGVLVWSALALPDRVPQHYGLDGTVDAYTSRTAFVIGGAVLVAALVAVVAGCARFSARRTIDWAHVKHADYWRRPENVDRMRRMAADDVWFIGSWTALLFITLGVQNVLVADDPEPTLGLWGILRPIIFLTGALAWAWYISRRRYTPPAEAVTTTSSPSTSNEGTSPDHR